MIGELLTRAHLLKIKLSDDDLGKETISESVVDAIWKNLVTNGIITENGFLCIKALNVGKKRLEIGSKAPKLKKARHLEFKQDNKKYESRVFDILKKINGNFWWEKNLIKVDWNKIKFKFNMSYSGGEFCAALLGYNPEIRKDKGRTFRGTTIPIWDINDQSQRGPFRVITNSPDDCWAKYTLLKYAMKFDTLSKSKDSSRYAILVQKRNFWSIFVFQPLSKHTCRFKFYKKEVIKITAITYLDTVAIAVAMNVILPQEEGQSGGLRFRSIIKLAFHTDFPDSLPHFNETVMETPGIFYSKNTDVILYESEIFPIEDLDSHEISIEDLTYSDNNMWISFLFKKIPLDFKINNQMQYESGEDNSHVQGIQIFAKVIEFSLESLLETKARIFQGPADDQGSADHQKACDRLRGIPTRAAGTEGEWGATL